MYGSVIKRGKFVWVHGVRGNFLCILDGDLAATVFSHEWTPWQVILHFPGGTSSILNSERFEDAQAAMARAEAILVGTSERVSFQQLDPWALGRVFSP